MQDYIPKKIDINQSIGSVTVKQYDNNSRFLHVTIADADLSDGDSNAFIMQDCSAALYIQPEGSDDPSEVNYVAGEVADPENGIVTFLLPGGVTQVVGRYKCEIWIYGGDAETQPIISTKPFWLVVEKSIRNDSAIEASASFSAVDKVLLDMTALKSQVNTLISLADSGEITPGSAEAEVISARIGWNGAVYADLGEAIRIQVDQCSQYRTGANGESINSLYQTYHYHLFEYTKEGAFYATQTDSVGGATVRRWDLPDLENNFIITNTCYGDNWMKQTAIQENSPDVFYRRIVPRSEPNGGYPSGGYPWRKAGDNFVQCREGINGQSATYNRHVYEYKKDGTFYVTPANWDDLPTGNANYIVTNARYGSWIMQTAVKANTPEIVYSRLISNNPADDNNTQYYWRKRSGVEMLDYWKHAVTNYLSVGLPILFLSGSTSGMSKKNAVELSYKWGDVIGTCSVNWQGSSSVSYPKKNYTINFYSALNIGGWGYHSKFCLKANFIDNSNALNVCGAKLWSQIVTNRGEHPAIAYSAPNKGAMDGFPCIVLLNDEFHGLYTFNIPKDIWAYGMGVSGSGHVLENEYIVTAEDHVSATQFRSIAELDGTDFKLEYSYGTTDEQKAETAAAAKTSLNNMLSTLSGLNSSGWASSANAYIDVNTAIDYMIFSALIANTDGVDKNFILTSYDGTKWWLNAYDLDSILGNYWTGGKYYAPSGDNDNKTSFAWLASTSKLFNLIWTYNRPALIQRYNELRNGILSEENVYMTFYNFCVEIPQVIIDEDNRKYPLKPGTSTETLSRIMEWYRQRLAFIDNEVYGNKFIQSNEITEVLTG